MFVRYIPDLRTPNPTDIGIASKNFLFIPGETQWVNEGDKELFLKHPGTKIFTEKGYFKFFQPAKKDAEPSDLASYSKEDFEQIVHGFYDLTKLTQFRTDMSHEDMLSKYIFRDQINKIEKLGIPKHLEYASRMFFSVKLTDKMYIAESKLSPTR